MNRHRLLTVAFMVMLAGFAIVLFEAYRTTATAQVPFQSPSQKNKAAKDTVKLLEKRFGDFGAPLNFRASVGAIAVPSKKSVSIQDLLDNKQVTVGALYLSTGSVRLQLQPGAYFVDVVQKEGRWVALLKNRRGDVKSTVPANITLGPTREQVRVAVERSFCYEINGGIVCI